MPVVWAQVFARDLSIGFSFDRHAQSGAKLLPFAACLPQISYGRTARDSETVSLRFGERVQMV